MLRGSIVYDYDYDYDYDGGGGSFSDECLRRMDEDMRPCVSV